MYMGLRNFMRLCISWVHCNAARASIRERLGYFYDSHIDNNTSTHEAAGPSFLFPLSFFFILFIFSAATMVWCIYFGAFFYFLGQAQGAPATSNSVMIGPGQLVYQGSTAEDGIVQYLGMPYAAPPWVFRNIGVMYLLWICFLDGSAG